MRKLSIFSFFLMIALSNQGVADNCDGIRSDQIESALMNEFLLKRPRPGIPVDALPAVQRARDELAKNLGDRLGSQWNKSFQPNLLYVFVYFNSGSLGAVFECQADQTLHLKTGSYVVRIDVDRITSGSL